MILIDSWPYDLMVTGEITLDTEITKFPIEQGADLTDHLRPLPPTINLEAVVSDTPIGDIANHPSRRVDEVTEAVFGSDMVPLPSAEAYDRLVAIHDESRLVTIEIPVASRTGKPGKRTFHNMGLAHLSVPLEFSGGLKFTATWERVNIAVNKRVTVRTATPSGKPKTKVRAVVGQEYSMVLEILWNMGTPPGSALVQATGTTPGSPYAVVRRVWGPYPNRVKLGVVYTGLSSPTIHVENGQYLTKVQEAAFELDLARDERQKTEAQQKEFSSHFTGPSEAEAEHTKNPSNLPPGLDLSRFTKPVQPTLPAPAKGEAFDNFDLGRTLGGG